MSQFNRLIVTLRLVVWNNSYRRYCSMWCIKSIFDRWIRDSFFIYDHFFLFVLIFWHTAHDRRHTEWRSIVFTFFFCCHSRSFFIFALKWITQQIALITDNYFWHSLFSWFCRPRFSVCYSLCVCLFREPSQTTPKIAWQGKKNIVYIIRKQGICNINILWTDWLSRWVIEI